MPVNNKHKLTHSPHIQPYIAHVLAFSPYLTLMANSRYILTHSAHKMEQNTHIVTQSSIRHGYINKQSPWLQRQSVTKITKTVTMVTSITVVRETSSEGQVLTLRALSLVDSAGSQEPLLVEREKTTRPRQIKSTQLFYVHMLSYCIYQHSTPPDL